MVIQLVGKG
jgi:hypothetical protein